MRVTTLLFLFATSYLQADGCKIRLDGRFVPEHEQAATILWAEGRETLYVAARNEPTKDANAWVIPIRSAATAIQADPVESIDTVTYYRTLKSQVRDRLKTFIKVAAAADSGGVCCVLLGGACDEKSATAKEVSRVEKLGMIVTVVSASSRDGLQRYLAAQGVDRRVADLSSLEPYFGLSEYAFVCAWVARRDEPVSATGLKIEFPSPNLWFPLRPTRAYKSSVLTVVYAKGFVRPAENCDLPDLKCDYIFAQQGRRSVSQLFEPFPFGEDPTRTAERYTRVTLTTDPQKWDRDLELVPGATAGGRFNLFIVDSPTWVATAISALFGALWGLLIPWCTIARANRQWGDWLFGAIAGAAICFSLWASILVLIVWRSLRSAERPNRRRQFLALVGVAVLHFAAVFAVCMTLMKTVAAD